MRCSVIENDESVTGWKAGSSVAYCKYILNISQRPYIENIEAAPGEILGLRNYTQG